MDSINPSPPDGASPTGSQLQMKNQGRDVAIADAVWAEDFAGFSVFSDTNVYSVNLIFLV